MEEAVAPAWVPLHETPDLREANAVCTSILAMEFDARLIDRATGEPIEDPEAEVVGPFAVQVRTEDAEALADVLPEILHEQRDFDASLEARDHSAEQWRRRAMLTLAIIVALLAVLGLLRL